MELFNNYKTYDFMGKNKIIFSISAAVMAFCLYFLVVHGFKLGVDFAGGTVVQLKYDSKPNGEQIREILKTSEFKGAEIQEFGKENEILVRFQTTNQNVTKDTGDSISKLLASTGKFEVRRVEIIGPKVGDELRQKGIMAMLISSLGILLYLAFRFEWRFGLAALIGVIHDVVITAGCVAFFGVDFDLTVLAALLTLMGHSINDTIIIFDRIREHVKDAKPDVNGKYSFAKIINEAISRTLSRTILTVLTLFFVILTLYLFGGEIIKGFAFTMLIGTIIGAYSSIFIASPFLIWLGYSVSRAKEKDAERLKAQIEKDKMRADFEKGTI
jgi:preprotein translocase subunit SecF